MRHRRRRGVGLVCVVVGLVAYRAGSTLALVVAVASGLGALFLHTRLVAFRSRGPIASLTFTIIAVCTLTIVVVWAALSVWHALPEL